MPLRLRVRALTEEERQQIKRLSQARTAPARAVERAQIVQAASEGLSVPAVAARVGIAEKVVRRWLVRFNAEGLSGLRDKPRSGRPVTYSREAVGVVIATALTDPKELGQAFGSWTFARLERMRIEAHERGFPVSRFQVAHGDVSHVKKPQWLADTLSVEALVSVCLTIDAASSDPTQTAEGQARAGESVRAERKASGKPVSELLRLPTANHGAQRNHRDHRDVDGYSPPGTQDIACPNQACICSGQIGQNNIRRFGMWHGQMEYFCAACGSRFIETRLIMTFDEDHGSLTLRSSAVTRAHARLARWRAALRDVCDAMLQDGEPISIKTTFTRARIPRSANLLAQRLGLRQIVETALAKQLPYVQELEAKERQLPVDTNASGCETTTAAQQVVHTREYMRAHQYRRSPKRLFRVTPIDTFPLYTHCQPR